MVKKTKKNQKPLRSAHSLAPEDNSVWHHFSRYVTPVQRKPYSVRNWHFLASTSEECSEALFEEGKERRIDNVFFGEKKEKPSGVFFQGRSNQRAYQGRIQKRERKGEDTENLEKQSGSYSAQRPGISAQTRLRPLQTLAFKHDHGFAAGEWRISDATAFKSAGKGVKAPKKRERKKGEKPARPLRKLDLHGLTVHRAFVIFYDFVINAYKDEVGCIEVITGMGNSTTGGLIKRELPLWLERPDIANFIHAVCYSSPQNYGALKIFLRKKMGRNFYF